MTEKLKSTHTQPGGLEEKNPPADDGMVNDSFGTVNIADSRAWMKPKRPATPSA